MEFMFFFSFYFIVPLERQLEYPELILFPGAFKLEKDENLAANDCKLVYSNTVLEYNKDPKANIDAAVDILDATLKTAPNFNLVNISKNELLRQKQALQNQEAQPKN